VKHGTDVTDVMWASVVVTKTNFMEKIAVLEKLIPKSSSQEIPCLLWNPKVHISMFTGISKGKGKGKGKR
jgi:hypothetical protein